MACSVLEIRFFEGLCYLIQDRWVLLIDIKSDDIYRSLL